MIASRLGMARRLPQFFDVSSTSATLGGSDFTATVPATAKVGQRAVAILAHQGGSPSVPTGWTQLAAQVAADDGGVNFLALYAVTIRVRLADIGATITWVNNFSGIPYSAVVLLYEPSTLDTPEAHAATTSGAAGTLTAATNTGVKPSIRTVTAYAARQIAGSSPTITPNRGTSRANTAAGERRLVVYDDPDAISAARSASFGVSSLGASLTVALPGG